MKKKIIRNVLFLLSSLLLLSACVVHPPMHSNIAKKIDHTLLNAIYNNKSLVRGAKQKTPSFVDQALTPKVRLNLPSAVLPHQRRINLTVKDMPAKDFFMGLVKDTKLSMMVDPKVEGAVSLQLKNVTIAEILEAVQDVYGYRYVKTTYGYKVFPKRLETRMFTVNYLALHRKGTSEITVSSGQITDQVLNSGAGKSSGSHTSIKPTSSVNTESTSDFWGSLKSGLEVIVGKEKGSKVVINPNAGLVIVRSYPDILNNVAKYLDGLQNVMQREVMLEAQVLEVQLDAQYQSGIDWKLLGLTQTGFKDPTQQFSTPIAGGDKTFNDNLTNFSSIFRGYFRSGSDFKAIVNLLNSQGKVNVLSSPRISTLNNQKAVIKVGSDNFFVTNVESETTASGGATETSQDIDFTPFFSGIALDVTPQIAANGDVILHIHPLISKVQEERKVFKVNDKDQDIPLAESTIRESDNIVRAKNGQVIIIGGLMESRRMKFGATTPGADRLKGVGGLFKRQKRAAEKFELVILLKPVVVGPNTWNKELGKSARSFREGQRDFGYKARFKRDEAK